MNKDLKTFVLIFLAVLAAGFVMSVASCINTEIDKAEAFQRELEYYRN